MPRIVPGAAFGAVVCLALGAASGCLDRPVVATQPITRTNFVTSIQQSAIDKIDLLFDIDNSASMGDKQAFLSRAIPDLITRLVTPNCVDANLDPTGKTVGADGQCATGQPEFAPIHDMHIGIVSSSLGPRLGDLCPTSGVGSTLMVQGQTIHLQNDDQGHLLDRSNVDPSNYQDTPLAAADPDHFLDWYPGMQAGADAGLAGQTPVTTTASLQTDFQDMVTGVHQIGCGLESQLESWYRFLVQPDPYASMAVDAKTDRANWVGVDTTILAQRANFLRPDSLVAVIVLSDENDSEVDVRSLGGEAWHFNSSGYDPPRGTSVCATHPNDPNCASCTAPGHASDPACALGTYDRLKNTNDWGYYPNLRHVHEKQKYGVTTQFPIERYVLGLTSPKVPDRNGEYPADETGTLAGSYQGLSNLDCTNPLFASKLPAPPPGTDVSRWSPSASDLCALPPSSRPKNLIFYAHIGGVPHELLQNTDGTQKDTLTDADWQLILGKDPEGLDYTGIDPHMVEAFAPRTAVPVPTGGFPVAAPGAPPDPISQHEWVTNGSPSSVDLEYACTFKLTDSTTGKAASRNCDPTSVMNDATIGFSCDCVQAATAGLPAADAPPVCDTATPTTQDYAKAYPTIRELLLAKLLGGVKDANEGIVSSLCPIHTEEATPGDPLFGYRPAMNSIVDSLRKALTPTCLPQRLQPAPDGDGGEAVPCLVLGTFPKGDDTPSDCSQLPGYADVDPTTLAHFQADQHAAFVNGDTATDLSLALTCKLTQLQPNEPCDQRSDVGWCYVGDGSHQGCAQAIVFAPGALTKGVITNLQCLEASMLSDAQ